MENKIVQQYIKTRTKRYMGKRSLALKLLMNLSRGKYEKYLGTQHKFLTFLLKKQFRKQ